MLQLYKYRDRRRKRLKLDDQPLLLEMTTTKVTFGYRFSGTPDHLEYEDEFPSSLAVDPTCEASQSPRSTRSGIFRCAPVPFNTRRHRLLYGM